jgi:UDP-N-acetylmuramyl pentapeptide phosphotransferase/UDP-N-acetylglucosamine-1-phosphate transferase
VTQRRLLAGAAAAQVALAALTSHPPGGAQRWHRGNYRGRPVTLLSGPALALSAGLTSDHPLPAVVAGVGSGLVGAYDDAAGDAAKGLRGHLTALRSGRLTAGGVKLVALPILGIAAAAATGRPAARRPADLLLGGAVVAGSANLLNLLDLRPGRALKVGMALGVALGEPGVVGSCAALLPGDLRERTMLGDAGANALGAVLGVAVVSRVRRPAGRAVVLTGLAALTAASERVSFSAVIDRTPALHRIDRLGRLP